MTSMPETTESNQPSRSSTEIILGVDTHRDVHVAVALTSLGALAATKAIPTTTAGYRDLLAWARDIGVIHRAGVEGTGSYGAALARYLRTEGIQVVEVNHGDKATRRRRGKTDALDAEAAARAVLSGRATATAKSGDGPVEMARMFKLAKVSAVKARTQAINQLKAVLVSADATLRESLTGPSRTVLIRRCAELDPVTPTDPTGAAIHTVRLLANRILHLTEEITDLQQRLATTVAARAPRLLRRVGIGPDNAATLLIAAGDNPDRLGSEASFAALCGASPVEASSGNTQRKRLNRGGNRQANVALYRIVLTRLRWDPPTRAYLQRRLAEGKTRREIIRCLKRYVAREVYPLLTPTP